MLANRYNLSSRSLLVGILVALALVLSPVPNWATLAQQANPGTYTNPLQARIPSGGLVENCPDPSIIHGQTPGDTAWYVYCTTDAINEQDHTAGGWFYHKIPELKSYDLVHWVYVGDAFSAPPGWASKNAGLWAPDIHFFNGKYYLYYTVTDTPSADSDNGGGSAIGVATSSSPTGPWTDSGGPVVEPHPAPCCPGSQRWVFDPMVVDDNGQKYIFYGSFFGGISARKLTPDGLHSDPASQTQIAIDNRYEGTWIMRHDGYWYFMGSATNCCNGQLTGYSVFAARSANILGPYVDKEGVSILDSRTGGTPVISMNGNRWVGPGHNAVFTDFDGQDWFLYHAVDRFDPYFTGFPGYTKRQLLMDRLDWIDGWPSVRGGLWASDTPQPAPAAQPGQQAANKLVTAQPDVPGQEITTRSDEFNGTVLSPQWTWVRQPAPGTYGLEDGTFRFDVQHADLYVDNNSASVLTEPAPAGNYVVETKVRLNVPPDGCCFNFAQAGLVIYHDDDNYIKLNQFANWDTRQTEFAKEMNPVPQEWARYGNTVVGPPGDWTWLRIVKETKAGEELYRAYTSNDGQTWVRGGVWTHHLGDQARIGLISMGLQDPNQSFTATFDYVRVYRLTHGQ
jgi:arabinan endo-1,5-alpha-L-arabinosidase